MYPFKDTHKSVVIVEGKVVTQTPFLVHLYGRRIVSKQSVTVTRNKDLSGRSRRESDTHTPQPRHHTPLEFGFRGQRS